MARFVRIPRNNWVIGLRNAIRKANPGDVILVRTQQMESLARQLITELARSDLHLAYEGEESILISVKPDDSLNTRDRGGASV